MLAAGLVLDRLVVRAEHVRVVPGLPPRLQAHPVGIRGVREPGQRRPLDPHLPPPDPPDPHARGRRADDRAAGIRVGEVLTELEVAGPFLRLAPKRATIAGMPTPLLRFFKGYLPLPPLPRGARITEVRPGDGELAVTFQIDELDEALTPDIARRLRTLTRLPIPGLG